MILIKLQPDNFKPEQTTIWSFPNRGRWATHTGGYRGNWSPYVPRNLILRYSKPGDWILDQFLGSGTTLIEAKLLNRNAIGIDVNRQSLELSKKNLEFSCEYHPHIYLREGNARNLEFMKDESIDLICTHPPYANIIQYSRDVEQDLSLLEHDDFLKAMEDVATESLRILKPERICAVMIGDIRKHGNVVPLGMETMQVFLRAGFRSKEIVIKEQHNCRSTEAWQCKTTNFLMLAHEYILIFQK